MRIEILPPDGDNYVCLVHDRSDALVIDPKTASLVLQAAQSRDLRLSYALVTHHHVDHTGGCSELKEDTGCEIIAPPDPRVGVSDRAATDGLRLDLLGTEFQVLHVPGHTRSHVAYYAPGLHSVWTGDTLFVAGCGRLIEGTAEELWASLRRLAALPPDTRVYCGHDYSVDDLEFAAEIEPGNLDVQTRLREMHRREQAREPTIPSTLAMELGTNPFLRCDEPALRDALDMRDAPAWQVFAELRRRKDRW